MVFRFRRSFQLLPGFRVSVSNKTASLRVGPRGAGFTVNSKGQKRVSAGIPGTGLHWSETIGGKKRQRRTPAVLPENMSPAALDLVPAEPLPWERAQLAALDDAERDEFGFLAAPTGAMPLMPAPPRPSLLRRLGMLLL